MDDLTREKFLDDLLKKRILYINGEITHEMSKRIGASILWLNAQDDSGEIILYINSAGGTVSAGLDIYDIVRHSKAPVTGIVYRIANSMAAIILQGCKTRKVLRHSQIVLHNINVNIEGEWHKLEEDLEEIKKRHLNLPEADLETTELEKDISGSKKRQQYIYDILAERTGKSMEEIIKVCREAKEMTSEEAKEFGLIDEII